MEGFILVDLHYFTAGKITKSYMP